MRVQKELSMYEVLMYVDALCTQAEAEAELCLYQ